MTAPVFSTRHKNRLFAGFGFFALIHPAMAFGQAVAPETPSAPEAGAVSPGSQAESVIAFSAAKVDYDSQSDEVTAVGDVSLERDGYRLRADTVVWNRKSGVVTATGNIRTVGPGGDVAYGDSITLTDSLKDGIVENLLLVLTDGGRLAAQRGQRTDGRLTLDYAAYSPCLVEKPDGCPKNPSWQVKAVKVTYDPAKKRVVYQGARLELFGLPLVPLPGLSHPAETKAGSGFLVPKVEISQNNGLAIVR
jgi:LPS-assembly protein